MDGRSHARPFKPLDQRQAIPDRRWKPLHERLDSDPQRANRVRRAWLATRPGYYILRRQPTAVPQKDTSLFRHVEPDVLFTRRAGEWFDRDDDDKRQDAALAQLEKLVSAGIRPPKERHGSPVCPHMACTGLASCKYEVARTDGERKAIRVSLFCSTREHKGCPGCACACHRSTSEASP